MPRKPKKLPEMILTQPRANEQKYEVNQSPMAKMPGKKRQRPIFRWRVMIEAYDEHSIIVEAATPHEACQEACEMFGLVENACGNGWTWHGGLYRAKMASRADRPNEDPPPLDYDGPEDAEWQTRDHTETSTGWEEGRHRPIRGGA